MSRHQPVCEFPRLLSRFYLFILLLLFFDPDVFYNPENENELLASMDIDHPVRIRGKKTV